MIVGINTIAQGQSNNSRQGTVPKQLFFELDEEQNLTYQSLKKNLSKDNFNLSISTDLESGQVAARAHMRGKGSFKTCKRKSFTLDLTGSGFSPLLPESKSEQYYLISMCLDNMYLRSNTFYRLWKAVDLFPLQFQMIELLISSESRGLYMLLEKPSDSMQRSEIPPMALLRRSYNPPTTFVEVNHSVTTNDLARLDYTYAFKRISELDPAQFIEHIHRVLDVDQFIRHLAVASIFRNGDYVDEMWFAQYPYPHAPVPPGYFYRVFKWDPDDLFHKCHYKEQFAYKDPWGMAYCVESELGKQILQTPTLYHQFVNQVENLLELELNANVFHGALSETYNRLQEKLADKSIRNAMDQFLKDATGQVNKATMQASIQNEAIALKNEYRNRRQYLLEKIAIYRQQVTSTK